MAARSSRGSSRTRARPKSGNGARRRAPAPTALQTGLDRLPVAFALFDAKLRLAAWNAGLASICRYPKRLLARGTSIEAFVQFNAERGDYGAGETLAVVGEELKTVRRKVRREREQRLADGRVIRISSRPVPPDHLLVTYEDVTEARLAGERYDFASRAVNEGIYDWDIAAGKIYFSERVYNAVGLSPDDFRTVADWRGRIHPDDLGRFDAGIVAHLKGKTDRFECDYRFRTRDGTWRWARQHGIALRDERGRAIRMIGSTGDINELKGAEEALRLSEERYTLAMRAATEGVYEWNLDTGKLYVSDTTKVFFWSRTESLTPESWNERVHPDDIAAYRKAIGDHFKGRTPHFELEYRIRDASGGYIWVLDRGVGVRDARKRVTRFVGAVSDVTQRKLAEQELRRAHEETTQALERQTATAEILHVIASSPTDVQPVLDAVAASAARLCEARDAIILLREGDDFRFAAHYGPIPNLPVGGTRRISRNTAVGRSMLEGRQIHVHDLQAETAEFPEGSAYAREFGYHTSLVTPLMREGAAIGTIMIRRTEVRPFSDKQIALVSTFADQAVIAIENVRLFNETKEALEQQTATAEVLRVISSKPTDTQPVFEAILRSAVRLCDSPLAAVFRYDGKLLHLIATENWPPEALATVKSRFPSEPDPHITVGRVILTAGVVCQEDTRADPDYDQSAVAAGGWRRMLGVPMLKEGAPIGTIVVAWPDPGKVPDKQVALLKTFADQAVIAIENVRLFNETKEALERQTATAEILRVISSTPTDTQPVFDAIVENAQRLIAGKSTALLLRRESQAVVAGYSGSAMEQLPGEVRAVPLDPRKNFPSRAILNGEIVHVPDWHADDVPEFEKRVGKAYGIRSGLMVPLLRKGEGIGAIVVFRESIGPFDEKEISLLQSFADQAVIAIENVRLFNETKEALERQTATAEILKVISSSPTDVQPVFDAIVRSGMRLFNGQGVGILLVDEDRLQLGSAGGSIDLETARKRYPLPLNRDTVSGQAILDRSFVNIADIEAPEMPELLRDLGRELGYRAIAAAPMMREGVATGSITVVKKAPGALAEKEVALLKTFADQAVIAIENVRLFNEINEALKQQTATAEVLKAISRTTFDLDSVLQTLLDNATVLCSAKRGVILRQDADGGFRPAVTHGWAQDSPVIEAVRARPLKPERGSATGRALLERRAVHIPDVLADPEYERQDLAIAGTYRTLLNVPMLRDGEPIGVISLTKGTEIEPFTDKQIELVTTFADQAVIAIENVRLFNETKEALERQTATAEVLRVISSSPTDVQPVFDAIVTSAQRLMGGFSAAVTRVVGDTLHLAAFTSTSETGDQALKSGYPRPLSQAPTHRRAVRSRAPYYISDTEKLPDEQARAREMARTRGYRSVLIVPMLRDEMVVGTISVTHREPGKFSTHQIELLTTFANQAVIAIENVRLFRELDARNKDLAETLQQQTATSEILKVISSSPTDVQPVFDAIVQNVVRLVPMCNAGINILEGDLIQLRAVTGATAVDRDMFSAIFPLPYDPVGLPNMASRVIKECRIVEIPDTEGPDVPDTVTAVGRVGHFRSITQLPLVREGQGIGTIAITHPEPGFRFDNRQQLLLKTFADQAVIAIENVRLFNETKEALERQTATAEVLRVISSSPTDTQPVFEAIVRSCQRLFDGQSVALALVADGQVVPKAGVDKTGADLALIPPWPLDRGSATGVCVLDNRAINLADLSQVDEAFPRMKDLALRLGYHSGLWVPLRRESGAIGGISILRRATGAFTEQEVSLAQTFADQAVIAIENVRLFNETREALQRQTATAEILDVISRSQTDVQPVFDTIAANALKLCEARFSVVTRFDGELIHVAALHNAIPEAANAIRNAFPRPPGRAGATDRAYLERKIVHIPDIREDPEYQLGGLAQAAAYRSTVCVPILRSGSAVGAVTVARPDAGPFPEQQIALLKTFADQAVIAIENVRLFKELQARTEALTRSVGQLTALGEVGQAISSTLDLETVLKTIVTRALQLSGLDGGAIYEYDEQAEEFLLRAAENLPEDMLKVLRRTPIRKGDGPVGQTLITREPSQIPEMLDESYQTARREFLLRAGYRALLVVPLLREDHVIGALSVSRKTPGPFSPEVVELLKTFATQSALAIQNARLFREIAEKSRQLEVASKHKSQFLASMSHELRTPLNAILGFNEMILDQIYGELPEDLKAPLENMQSSGKHLLRLINNVLDLAKIEAGRMELALSDYSVQDTVASVHSTLKPLAADKGLEFLASVPQDIPLAYGDGGRIAQCLMNLAGNSIKFTKAGKVEIAVQQKDSLLVYRVADTGVGIPPDKIGSLFTEFKQTDATIASEYGGTGLGLSITKKFIEMHGGRVWVESEPGKGSTFLFEIPLRAAQ